MPFAARTSAMRGPMPLTYFTGVASSSMRKVSKDVSRCKRQLLRTRRPAAGNRVELRWCLKHVRTGQLGAGQPRPGIARRDAGKCCLFPVSALSPTRAPAPPIPAGLGNGVGFLVLSGCLRPDPHRPEMEVTEIAMWWNCGFSDAAGVSRAGVPAPHIQNLRYKYKYCPVKLVPSGP